MIGADIGTLSYITCALLAWILIRSILAFNKAGLIVLYARGGCGVGWVTSGRKGYETDDDELFGLNNF